MFISKYVTHCDLVCDCCFMDVSSALGAAIFHTLYVFSVSVGGRGEGKSASDQLVCLSAINDIKTLLSNVTMN